MTETKWSGRKVIRQGGFLAIGNPFPTSLNFDRIEIWKLDPQGEPVEDIGWWSVADKAGYLVLTLDPKFAGCVVKVAMTA